MKKNLTKKLMLSVLTLAFAVVSLGASTFAWFTLSGSVKVASFDATVTGGYGLDVCVTPLNEEATLESEWLSGNLTLADIQAVIGTEEILFNAVSPEEQKLAKKANFWGIDGKIEDGEAYELNKDYIGFNLNFKITDPNSVKEDIYLVLDSLTITNTAEVLPWNADISYSLDGTEDNKVTAGDDIEYDVLNAVRFGIYNWEDSKQTIYEKVGAENAVAGQNTEGFSSFGALDYYNNKLNLAGDDRYAAPASPYTTTVLTDAMGLNAKQELFKFTPNSTTTGEDGSEVVAQGTNAQIVTIAVYVWIEGWDAECLNAIFSQNVTVAMEYAIYKKDADGSYKAA